MKRIQLTQGRNAIVDDEDFDRLSEFRWCFRKNADNDEGYAVRQVGVGGRQRITYMHREIMPAPSGCETIFLNHDRLDCRRRNLMVVPPKQARQHHRVRRDSYTGVKGVYQDWETGSYQAYLCRERRTIQLGTFPTVTDAAAAYREALLRENFDLHVVEPANGQARPRRRRSRRSTREGVQVA